ncbi:MAG: HNH endonuclease [Acidimicrobiia bacterium]|nr:HNH endonuclease [Acidimicrobiia bacterium]
MVGERFYLLRTGDDGGIVATGMIAGLPFSDHHWEFTDEETDYVPVEFDALTAEPLPTEVLEATFPGLHWRPQASGTRISSPDAVEAVDRLFVEHLARRGIEVAGESRSPEELGAQQMYSEGSVRRVSVNSYERNTRARRACLEHYGDSCAACGFNFGEVYGPEGEGFIHVHHVREISSIGAEYQVDPINDLIPLCPNCHAMAHHKRQGQAARTIGGLRGLIDSQRQRP